MKREASIISPTQTLQFHVECKSDLRLLLTHYCTIRIMNRFINRYFWLRLNHSSITQKVVLQYIKCKHFYNNIHVRIPAILHASSAYICATAIQTWGNKIDDTHTWKFRAFIFPLLVTNSTPFIFYIMFLKCFKVISVIQILRDLIVPVVALQDSIWKY